MYQVDTARNGAGILVEHANRQGCCLQLDSGRSLDPVFREFAGDTFYYVLRVRNVFDLFQVSSPASFKEAQKKRESGLQVQQIVVIIVVVVAALKCICSGTYDTIPEYS